MNDFVELRKIVTVVLRWWWLLLLVTAVGAGAGYAYSKTQTPVYRATTTLLVGQSIQSTALDSRAIAAGEQLALTYANIIHLQPVMSVVTDKLGLSDSWKDLADRVSTTPVENTQLLRISAEADSVEEAIAIADEIANTVIQLSPTTLQNKALDEDRSFANQRLETLRANISEGQKRIDALELQIPTTKSVSDLQKIQDDIDSLQNLISGWENNYSRLLDFSNQTSSPNFLTVVEPAQGSSSPIRPVTLVNMLALAMVAFALTAGGLVLREFMKESPDSVDTILHDLGLQSLGSVGTFKANKLPERLIIKHNLFSAVSEDYRLLRSKIQYVAARWQRRVLIVTSASSQDLQSVVTANLGIVMAQAGLRTVIIDTNLRHPRQHELFELTNDQGLAETLHAADEDCSAVLQETSVHNLRVLTAGSLPTLYPTELLSSPRMQKLLDRLSKEVDVILCESAEVVHFADTMVLSSQVDGVVLVVDGSKSERAITSQAVGDLKQAGANLIGVVIQSSKVPNSTQAWTSPANNIRSNVTQFTIQGSSTPLTTNNSNGRDARVQRSRTSLN